MRLQAAFAFPRHFTIFNSIDLFGRFSLLSLPLSFQFSKYPHCPHDTSDLPVTSNHLSDISLDYLQSAVEEMKLLTKIIR